MASLSLAIMPMLQIASGGLKIFSGNKIALSGTPAPLNRGNLPIKLTITDTLGETASTYFSITVLNNPPIAPTIEPQTVHHAFNWTIPEFSDSDGDPLTYSATLADGSPLPDWVSFNSTTRILSGVVPPVVTVRKINIQADDSHGGIANATQTINVVNSAPALQVLRHYQIKTSNRRSHSAFHLILMFLQILMAIL